ncbi:DNA N-6-adenine-methyltransferase [Nannocystis pusilla]|uniref:DNA N-6-adenine-methyltransferase n=1 Tax=Nannocystis pusilla TaxID=889268 RepID=UPI003DA30E64
MLKESDRYFTPAWLVEAVLEQLGGSIDLDPCWDPDAGCVVRAEEVFDIRKSQDGLVLPWDGTRVFCNPPYSDVAPWVLRAVQHAANGGEVLMLINASTDTSVWQRYVLRHGCVCLLNKRVSFGRPGSNKLTPNLQASAVVYFGTDVAGFVRVWSKTGSIIRRVDGEAAQDLR